MIDKFMYDFLNRVYDLEDYTQLEINLKLIYERGATLTSSIYYKR